MRRRSRCALALVVLDGELPADSTLTPSKRVRYWRNYEVTAPPSSIALDGIIDRITTDAAGSRSSDLPPTLGGTLLLQTLPSPLMHPPSLSPLRRTSLSQLHDSPTS